MVAVNKSLTKQEAVDMMRDGVKVAHSGFTPDEWMTMKDGKILFEDGCRCTEWEFWRSRTQDYWDTGWSIWKCKSA